VETSTLVDRLSIGLPFGATQPIPQLDGSVTLVASHTDHVRPGYRMGATTGTIELQRGQDTQRIDFEANRAFEAWGYRMAVFGMGGNLELGIFPEGATFEP
jgi:hypothetical protein